MPYLARSHVWAAEEPDRIVCVLCALTGRAQQAITPPTLTDLEQQVQQLRQELSLLEAQLAAQAVQPTVQQESLVPPAAESLPKAERINFRGVGELNYKALDQRKPEIASGGFVAGSAANFYTGNFDLLLTAPIGPRAHVLAEINFEAEGAQDFDVDVDRVLLTYDFRNWRRASAGRYQTSIGYYNTVFISSAWPQTTVDRPLIMAFPDEGGVLPVQALGLSLEGAIPSGDLGLNYVFEYGSSDTIRARLNAIGSDDENNGEPSEYRYLRAPTAFQDSRLAVASTTTTSATTAISRFDTAKPF
jgi:hypothetical protein